MNNAIFILAGRACAVLLMLCVLGLPMNAQAQSKKKVQIVLKNGNPIYGDKLMTMGKGYKIFSGAASREISFDQVAYVKVPKPANLDSAMQAAANESVKDNLVTFLEGIVKTYERQQWDAVAGPALIKVYVNKGSPQKARQVYENLVRLYGEDKLGAGVRLEYWNAMIALGQGAKVKADVKKIMTGNFDPMVQAGALLKLGDVLASEGKYEEALVEGYFKTILMYKGAAKIHPQAYLGAYKMLKNMKDPRAERMRKQLLTKYPRSREARKITSGV